MSDLDQAIQELEDIESEHRRERRIRWVDYGLYAFWLVLWGLVWVWRPFDIPSFKNSRWNYFLTFFVVYIGFGLAIFGSKVLVDRLFKTGRKSNFLSYLFYLAIWTIAMVVIFTILTFAASKTADYLF